MQVYNPLEVFNKAKHLLKLRGFSIVNKTNRRNYIDIKGKTRTKKLINIRISKNKDVTNDTIIDYEEFVKKENITFPIIIAERAHFHFHKIAFLSSQILDQYLDYVDDPDLLVVSFSNNLFLKILDLRILHFMDQYVKINTMYIIGNNISSIHLEPLSRCTNLEVLLLEDNKLEHVDLKPIKRNNRLYHLSLQGNNLREINLLPLSRCEGLKSLLLKNNRIRSIILNPLQNCTELQELDIGNNKLLDVDLYPLKYCQQLKSVILKENILKKIDISQLASIPTLEHLDISFNEIELVNLQSFYNSKSLEYLCLNNNRLKFINLAPLKNSKSLYLLDLRGNRIKELDITPLIRLKELQFFSIDDDVSLVHSVNFLNKDDLPEGIKRHYDRIVAKETIIFEPMVPSGLTGPFFCQICSERHRAGTSRMQCLDCGRFVCAEAYSRMIEAGWTKCPMCKGELTSG